MTGRRLSERVLGRYQRSAARLLFRRWLPITTAVPLVSFTFDDFPRSALLTAGAILNRFNAAGTYYASLGLMGKRAPAGEMFLPEDLQVLLEQGHELGCHTFAHCHSWETSTAQFERSVLQNDAALRALVPTASFRTLSYPLSPPRPLTKRMLANRFVCCRGGGQSFNAGTADLNYLSAFFLEKSGGDRRRLKALIDENRRARGWLLFATHDVCRDPSAFGCTPDFFQDVVRYALDSGSRVLTVTQAYDVLRTCAGLEWNQPAA
jgi:peptidoglycan/xylan/chitin deacetylase (PgdA/CDA1 family)